MSRDVEYCGVCGDYDWPSGGCSCDESAGVRMGHREGPDPGNQPWCCRVETWVFRLRLKPLYYCWYRLHDRIALRGVE